MTLSSEQNLLLTVCCTNLIKDVSIVQYRIIGNNTHTRTSMLDGPVRA